jgi:hypothetical protein
MKLAKMQRMGMYERVTLCNAYAMSRLEYNEMRGWIVPDDEEPLDLGMIIVTNEDEDNEHLCWVTMEVFEEQFKKIED